MPIQHDKKLKIMVAKNPNIPHNPKYTTAIKNNFFIILILNKVKLKNEHM